MTVVPTSRSKSKKWTLEKRRTNRGLEPYHRCPKISVGDTFEQIVEKDVTVEGETITISQRELFQVIEFIEPFRLVVKPVKKSSLLVEDIQLKWFKLFGIFGKSEWKTDFIRHKLNNKEQWRKLA